MEFLGSGHTIYSINNELQFPQKCEIIFFKANSFKTVHAPIITEGLTSIHVCFRKLIFGLKYHVKYDVRVYSSNGLYIEKNDTSSTP